MNSGIGYLNAKKPLLYIRHDLIRSLYLSLLSQGEEVTLKKPDSLELLCTGIFRDRVFAAVLSIRSTRVCPGIT
jgi:hypothetical protein